jgi:hypothetical protein
VNKLDTEARRNVLTALAIAHDRFVDTERMHRSREEHATAEGAHRVSIWLLRAYAAERDDPEPEGDTLRHVG